MKPRVENQKQDEDDGRTIADMNVEGMPWYNPRRGKRPDELHSGSGGKSERPLKPIFRERLAVLKAAISVLIPLILFFGAGYALILLFLQKVWLSQ